MYGYTRQVLHLHPHPINLAIALSRQKRDVLLIDGDEQGTAMAFTDLRSAQKDGKPGYGRSAPR